MLRLIKLLRLASSSRIIKRWETRNALPYAKIAVVKLLLQVLYFVHLFACILILQTNFGSKLESWLATQGYCLAVGEFNEPPTAECVSEAEQYLASFFWAICLVLGLSSLPLPGPWTPNTPTAISLHTHEVIVTVVLAFAGAVIWAYVIALLVDVIVSSDPDATAFRNGLDELNRFMKFNRLPSETCMRLRAFYHERRQIQQAESRVHVCSSLSPMLLSEIAWEINKIWLDAIPFLNLDSAAEVRRRALYRIHRPIRDMQHVRTSVAQSLRPFLFAPKERVPPRRLYVSRCSSSQNPQPLQLVTEPAAAAAHNRTRSRCSS